MKADHVLRDVCVVVVVAVVMEPARYVVGALRGEFLLGIRRWRGKSG